MKPQVVTLHAPPTEPVTQPKIEKGVPPPSRSAELCPVELLEVGDSFVVPSAMRNALNARAAYFKKRHPGWEYTIKERDGTARIWRLAGILAALLFATPAFAWTNTNNGHNNQIVDGGPGAQANARGGAGGNAKATGGHATSSTGPVAAQGGTSGASVTLSGVGGTSYRQAPDVNLPSIGGGGFDCPTVGFGAGGSGLGGGGGIGPSWISSDCNKRKVAAELAEVYGRAVARAYMEREISGVKEAVAAAYAGNHTEYPYDWCYTRDAGNRHQREVCEGKR